jgi:type IV secretory pathway TrbL component
MNWVTILADLFHLIVTVPVLFVGIVIGALGYRYILKKDPAALANLVAIAHAELQKLATTTAAKAAAAIPPSVVTQTPAASTTPTPPAA